MRGQVKRLPSRRPLPVETIRIDGLAIGGAGVGRGEGGRTVFVPLSVPGDLLEAHVDARDKPARGTVRRLLEPGATRVQPPCAYHARCGACDWMQLAPDAQRAAHRTLVTNAIRHATELETLPEVREHSPTEPLGYRTRARLWVRGTRSTGGAARAEVGYRTAGTHELCAIDRCVVLDPALAPLLLELPHLFAGAAGQGDVLVALGEGRRPVLDIAWRGELPPDVWSALDEATRAGAAPGAGRWAGAQVRLDGASQPQAFGDPRPVGVGADGCPLRFAPGGFAQTSDAGAAMLAQGAAALASPEGKHVLELFAGSGTLSVLLARGAASFQAVELDAVAAACARDNLAARGLQGRVTAADADDFAVPRVQAVVLDPPRTGAAGAVRHIVAARPRVVVYVACDVATLARDLRTLVQGGYRLTDLETVELFPQTSHVETLARLER